MYVKQLDSYKLIVLQTDAKDRLYMKPSTVFHSTHCQKATAQISVGCHRGRMVVGFTTTYVISAYHH